MIRVGLIGLGEVGQHHRAAILEATDATLAWACDLDDALLAASGAERTTHAVAELLADPAVDAVSIRLPHHLHLPIALQALAAGKHVLVEKPLTMTVREADELIAAAAAAGRSVGVSHNQVFFAPHVRARQLIDEGGVGQLRQLRARLAIGGKYGAWRSDPAKAGGGLLFDAGVHRVYVLRQLGGEGPAAVTAVMDRAGAEDGFVVTLEFASGALGGDRRRLPLRGRRVRRPRRGRRHGGDARDRGPRGLLRGLRRPRDAAAADLPGTAPGRTTPCATAGTRPCAAPCRAS